MSAGLWAWKRAGAMSAPALGKVTSETLDAMTLVKVVLVGGPVDGALINKQANGSGAPSEWHEMVVCPRQEWTDLSQEVHIEHHFYRRAAEPVGDGPDGALWVYQYQTET